MVEPDRIGPGGCGFKIIKELIKPGNLGRLDGLGIDNSSGHGPEHSTFHNSRSLRLPGNPQFGIQRIPVPDRAVRQITTEADSRGNIAWQVYLGVSINIGMLCLAILLGDALKW